jgi:hypothetical protein
MDERLTSVSVRSTPMTTGGNAFGSLRLGTLTPAIAAEVSGMRARPFAAVDGKRSQGFALIRGGDGLTFWLPEANINTWMSLHGVTRLSEMDLAAREEGVARQLIQRDRKANDVSAWCEICSLWHELGISDLAPHEKTGRYFTQLLKTTPTPAQPLLIMRGLGRLKKAFPRRGVLGDWELLMTQPVLHSVAERMGALLVRYLSEEALDLGISWLDVLFKRT